jgi:4-hydroxybenzoate polyprenyltransferase
MAAVLNAASNALNQIYDLEIDRVNKPLRPLPSGRSFSSRRSPPS